jgi:RimJ/RimL family protein N-acetyltransferase
MGNDPDFPPIALSGALAEGQLVRLCWPDPGEYDLITALRNQPSRRRWFIDDRPLDAGKNRAWLGGGMNRPAEALLSIRWRADSRFLGTIGWSGWDPRARRADFGRLALDHQVLHHLRLAFPAQYAGVAMDAVSSLAVFAFTRMNLLAATICFLEDNHRSAYLAANLGFEPRQTTLAVRPGGARIGLIEMEMTKARHDARAAGGLILTHRRSPDHAPQAGFDHQGY